MGNLSSEFMPEEGKGIGEYNNPNQTDWITAHAKATGRKSK